MVILSFYCNEKHIIVKNSPFFLCDNGAGTETNVRDSQMLSCCSSVVLSNMGKGMKVSRSNIKQTHNKNNKHAKSFMRKRF